MNCSMVAACQLAGEDGSVFSRPKSPSDAALPDAPLARHQVAVTVGRIMIFSDWLSRYRFRSAATTPTLNALGLPAVNWCTLKGALVNYRLAMPIAARSVKKSQIMKRSNHSSVAIIGFCIASFSASAIAQSSVGAAPKGDAKVVVSRTIKHNFPSRRTVANAVRAPDGRIRARRGTSNTWSSRSSMQMKERFLRSR